MNPRESVGQKEKANFEFGMEI